MPGIFKNVTGNMIMINETGTEIPPDAEFDIDDHPELERSHQFKRLVSMNFVVSIPAKRNGGDPVKMLQVGTPVHIDTTDVIRQLAVEMGAAFKEALLQQGSIDVDRLARQVGEHIMQNGGMVADKDEDEHVKVPNGGFEVDEARARMMDSALRFRSEEDLPSVSVQEEIDEGDDLGGAASRLKRTLEREGRP